MTRFLTTFLMVTMTIGSVAAANPVVAVLDPDKNDRAALLEAKLLADPALTMVERATVDQLLKEQELQAAFGPQGVGQRVKLGAVLKADLLVMVRVVKKTKEPTLEIVISETAGGLRLLARPVPISKDSTVDATTLHQLVHDGLKKYAEEVRAVVAVPPLVSRDLTYELDYLREAYAKIAEQAALMRRGVVVVELAEAEAVARELQLAAPGVGVRRPPATLFLGEYRHAGTGGERTVALKLWTVRGGKPVGEPIEKVVPTREAPATVRGFAEKLVDSLVPQVAGVVVVESDPQAEAKQFAARARDFRRVGNWAESLALIEASLLLNADQPELRAEAAEALGQRCAALPSLFSAERKSQEVVAQIIRFNRRALDHLAVILASPIPPTDGNTPTVDFRAAVACRGLAYEFPLPHAPEVAATIAEAKSEERATALRLMNPPPQHPVVGSILIQRALPPLPPKERYALLERLVQQAQHLPKTNIRVRVYLECATPPLELISPELIACVDRLLASENAEVREGATAYRKFMLERQAVQAAAANRAHPDQVATATGGAVRFQPLTFSLAGPPNPLQPRLVPNGICAAGPGVDVILGYYAIYLMKEQGKLQMVYDRTAQMDQMQTVSFDGRYVWAVVRRRAGTEVLVVIDPETERVWELSGDDGLPLPPASDAIRDGRQSIRVAVLGPGRVCVAGAFGPAWVAVASFDSTKSRPMVRVIHEARDTADRTDREQWKKTTVAFTPDSMVTVRGVPKPDGTTPTRVMILRGNPMPGYGRGLQEIREHPLVVDPDRGTVEVLASSIASGATNNFAEAGGNAYLIQSQGETVRVYRLRYPDLAKELVTDAITTAQPNAAVWLVEYQSRLHLMRTEIAKVPPGTPQNPKHQWWTMGLDGKELRRASGDTPRVVRVGLSSHYGLAAILGINQQLIPHAVEFPEPTKR